MSLHPQVQGLLDQLAAANAPAFSALPPAQARQAFATLINILPPAEAEAASIRDLQIPGPAGDITLRLYTPADAETPSPALVYFHGGGFVIGDLDCYDPLCRTLCAGSGCTVLSVDYRLAPEHPFPAAPDDCLAATRWVFDNADSLGIDAARIAVGGDSAGGNLAAVTTLRLRDAGAAMPRAQLLIYPATNVSDSPTQSVLDNAEGYLLTRADMEWFLGNYIGQDHDPSNPDISPIRAASHADLPPARVITAAYDPLCDDGLAYANALEAAGVEVSHAHHPDTIHGFFSFFTLLDGGREEVTASCDWLKQQLAR